MKNFPVEANTKKEYNCGTGKVIVRDDIFKEVRICEPVKTNPMTKALIIGGEELIDCLYFCLALLNKGAPPQEAFLAFLRKANYTSQETP